LRRHAGGRYCVSWSQVNFGWSAASPTTLRRGSVDRAARDASRAPRSAARRTATAREDVTRSSWVNGIVAWRRGVLAVMNAPRVRGRTPHTDGRRLTMRGMTAVAVGLFAASTVLAQPAGVTKDEVKCESGTGKALSKFVGFMSTCA